MNKNTHILFHDAEIDDQFNKVGLNQISECFGEYICSDKKKFEGPQFEVKKKLYHHLFNSDLSKLERIMTDGKGNLVGEIPQTISSQLKSFLQIHTSKRKWVVLTGQCAPVIELLSQLLRDETTLPIAVIWINGGHNSASAETALSHLGSVKLYTNPDIQKATIHEFSAHNSVSHGLKLFKPSLTSFADCNTSPDFKVTSDILNEYAKIFNGSLFTNEWFISKVKEHSGKDVTPHVQNLFNNAETAEELPKILKSILEDPNVNEKDKGYFKPKKSIWEQKLVQFPLHDIAAFFIMNMTDTSFSYKDCFCYVENRFIKLSIEKPENPLCQVRHYYAIDPHQYVKMISDFVEQNQ